MAHFAELNEKNEVLRVIVVNNNELLDENGVEQEQKGIAFCQSLFGGTWVQTSYNASFRKNYAGVGYKYNSELDAFIGPQPFNSWILNETTARWEAPIPYPDDGETYEWDEETTQWKQVVI